MWYSISPHGGWYFQPKSELQNSFARAGSFAGSSKCTRFPAISPPGRVRRSLRRRPSGRFLEGGQLLGQRLLGALRTPRAEHGAGEERADDRERGQDRERDPEAVGERSGGGEVCARRCRDRADDREADRAADLAAGVDETRGDPGVGWRDALKRCDRDR